MKGLSRSSERQLNRDLVDLQFLALALVEIADLAVLQAHVVEGDAGQRGAAAGGGRCRRLGRARRRRGGRRGGGELPVGRSLLIDLERDDGIDQHQPVDLDAPAEQRQELQLHLELGELGHLRGAGAGRVGEGDVVGLEREARQQRERHLPIDLQLAAGGLLDRGHELVLVGVDRNEEGRGNRHDDHQDDEDRQPDQQLFHGFGLPCPVRDGVMADFTPPR